jgi:ribonuclease BN (tRNA processing enzyme)
VIGCAGSFPSPQSPASSYLVEVEDAAGRTWRVLLDAGSGSLGPLQRYVQPRNLDAVLLSHLHADHCLDLCGMYVALRYHPDGLPGRRIPVYGPAGTFRRLADAYGAQEGDQLALVFDVRSWVEAEPVEIGPLRVVPMRVDHPVEAYGLRLEHPTDEGATVLTYSGDTDACPALTRLAEGADILLAEAAFTEERDQPRHIHLTGLRAGRTAAAAGAHRLLLTHIPVWNDPAVVLAEARSAFDGDIEIVRPGGLYRVRTGQVHRFPRAAVPDPG